MITVEIPQRWQDLFRLLPGYDPVATAGDCYFDARVAESAIAFFPEYMTHIEGEKAGQPFELEPWQQAVIGCAFGWKRPNGKRRYREVFQYVPRKNGKSTQLGGLINLVAFCDNEAGAQIYSAAAEREQAALVYRQAKGMILNNEELAEQVKIYTTFKSIEYPNGVVFKALSADADTKHGFNTHFVAVDELHAQRNRDLVDVLVTSTGSRSQPLVWYITTSDFDRDSICNEKHDYACKVRDGIIEDYSFLPVVFEASVDDDWTSPEVWHKANPNLGVSVSLEYLERECKRAQETPAYENTFKRLHLNIRTQQDVRWLQMEKWDASGCKDPLEWRKMALESLEGSECYGGLDLSTTTDITAFVLVFDAEEGTVLLPFFWIPSDNAERREKRDRVPYLTWSRQGFITMTPGNVIDYDIVRRDINALSKRFNIRKIARDRWNATQITTQLMGDGFDVVDWGQGFGQMSAPSKELETRLIGGKLLHGGNPVLRWMASNAAAELDSAGNIKPSKKKSTERIDGIVASVMALGLLISEEQIGPSIYETYGNLSL